MKYHLTSARMAVIKSIGKDVKKLEPSYIASRNVKWCNLCRKQFSGPSKGQAWNLCMTQQVMTRSYVYTPKQILL